MKKKILIKILPLFLILSCNENSSDKEGKSDAPTHNISICTFEDNPNDHTQRSVIEGDKALAYLVDFKDIADVKIIIPKTSSLKDEQILDCLNKVTFTPDNFSVYDCEACLEEISKEKFLPSSHKNQRNEKGKNIYTYQMTFK